MRTGCAIFGATAALACGPAALAQAFPPGAPLPPGYTESASQDELQARRAAVTALNAGRTDVTGTNAGIEDALAVLEAACFATAPTFDGADAVFVENDMTLLSPTGMRLDQVRNMSGSVRDGSVISGLPSVPGAKACSVGYAFSPTQDFATDLAKVVEVMSPFMARYPEYQRAPDTAGWIYPDLANGRVLAMVWEAQPTGLAGFHLQYAPIQAPPAQDQEAN